MPRPVSRAERERARELFLHGVSPAKVARDLNMPRSTAYGLRREWRELGGVTEGEAAGSASPDEPDEPDEPQPPRATNGELTWPDWDYPTPRIESFVATDMRGHVTILIGDEVWVGPVKRVVR